MSLHWLDDEVDAGIRRREFDVHANGRPVPGVWWVGERGSPVVCFGHGASGDRHQPPIPSMARRMVREHGFHALAIDGPVHGRRQAGPGGREAFADEWRREGTEADMTADWRAAIDAILPEAGNGPLGYWGLSMGTIYGAPLVAGEQRIEAAVLGLMGVLGPRRFQAAVADAAARIACPLLFIQQLEDEIVPRDAALTLFDAFASQDKRLHANPGLHPEVPVEEIDFSVAFLARYLTRGGMPREAAFSVPAGPMPSATGETP